MKLPEKLRDVNRLDEAIVEASRMALDKGVPLTMERLAVVIGVNRCDLSAVINGHKTSIDGNEIATDVINSLKKAVDICVADVMEHGMIRGNNPVMPIFNLRNNHGYTNNDPQRIDSNVTVIINDKDIPD